MKGENDMSVAMKLIGTLRGNKVFRSVVESAFEVGAGKNAKGIQQVINFKFVDSKGNVTKELRKLILDKSSIPKSAVRTMRKENWSKADKNFVYNRYNGSSWDIKDLKNGTSTTYAFNSKEVSKEFLKGNFREALRVGLTPDKKSVQMYGHLKSSKALPHLDSYVQDTNVKNTPWTSLVDFLKTL